MTPELTWVQRRPPSRVQSPNDPGQPRRCSASAVWLSVAPSVVACGKPIPSGSPSRLTDGLASSPVGDADFKNAVDLISKVIDGTGVLVIVAGVIVAPALSSSPRDRPTSVPWHIAPAANGLARRFCSASSFLSPPTSSAPSRSRRRSAGWACWGSRRGPYLPQLHAGRRAGRTVAVAVAPAPDAVAGTLPGARGAVTPRRLPVTRTRRRRPVRPG